jgi:hypothetical protein
VAQGVGPEFKPQCCKREREREREREKPTTTKNMLVKPNSALGFWSNSKWVHRI